MKRPGYRLFLSVAACLLVFLGNARPDIRSADLEDILRKEAEYCRKLENCIFDFICLEEIVEKINQSKDIRIDQSSWTGLTDGVWIRSKSAIPPNKVRRTFVYDYQYIRKDKQVKESRILLEENGKKAREEGARLKTANFTYHNGLLGPAGLFGERWQPLFDYRIVGETKVGGKAALILDAVPRVQRSEIPFLYGKAYIDRRTFDILKIEWSEQKIGNYEMFEKRGQRYGLRPCISMTSEFSVEKNGIRFPTRFSIEEAYLDTSGKKFVRSETTVVYKDFKFFTVEIEVR